MAGVNTTQLRTARNEGAAPGANFTSRRERKQVRKSMVRAAIANGWSERKLARQERIEFYRNLRQLKMFRRQIAKQMRVLAEMAVGLQREVWRVPDREPDVAGVLWEEASAFTSRAVGAVQAAADEFEAFARRRVYFTEVA